MRPFLRSLLAITLLAFPASAELRLDGFLIARGGFADGPRSWVDGGSGRLPTGSADDDDGIGFGEGQLHLALDWEPDPRFRAFVHALARGGSEEDRGEEIGLVEAWVEGRFFLRAADELRLRAGLFFLPSSRENRQLLWSSPYTLSWSAVNSWIGEEVRPLGVSAEYRAVLPSSTVLAAGGSAYVGNDASGALLAWRGWTVGDRLGVWDETLPLPPNRALEDGEIFERQNDAGTRPLGSDLDDREGWAAWVGWERPDAFALRWTRSDTRGDRTLYRGEYAWQTTFDLVGAEIHPGEWSFVAEWMEGETGMGNAAPGAVLRSQMDFRAAYALASWSRDAWRITLRYDDFEVRDIDRNPVAVDNDESGSAWTAALLWDVSPSLRVAAELVALEAERHEGAVSGFDVEQDGHRALLELRWYF